MGPSRVLVAELSRAAYSAVLWRLVLGRTLVLAGRPMSYQEWREIGAPPDSWD